MARGFYPDGLIAGERWGTALVKGRVATSYARLPLTCVGLHRRGLHALAV